MDGCGGWDCDGIYCSGDWMMGMNDFDRAKFFAFIRILVEKAEEKTASELSEERGEEFNPVEFCGNNFDDCYTSGVEDGKVLQSRIVLAKLEEMGLVWDEN
jgi:hypothetical protein